MRENLWHGNKAPRSLNLCSPQSGAGAIRMQLNGGITHLEQAELESQVPGGPGRGTRRTWGGHLTQAPPVQPSAAAGRGSVLGYGS